MFRRQVYTLFTIEEIKTNVFAVVTFATLLACGFAIFEFVSVNLLGQDLSFIPRAAREEYRLKVDGFLFRARSFMSESGYFSFYWEMYAPLAVYWLNKNANTIMRYMAFFILFMGLFLSFSSFGYVCMILWVALLFVHKLEGKNKIYGILSLIFGLGIILLLMELFIPEMFDMLIYVIDSKLDSSNSSYEDRESRFEVLKYFNGISIFIGYGPDAAGTLNTDSFISFYLGVLMNTGIIGLAMIFMFFICQLNKILKLRDLKLKFSFFLSFIFSCMHLMFIDLIYFPWVWVMYSLLSAIRYKERDMVKKQNVNLTY